MRDSMGDIPKKAHRIDSGRKPSTRIATLYSRRSLLGVLGAASIGAIAGCLGTTDDTYDGDSELSSTITASLAGSTLYKAPNCSCCLEYTAYLEEEADADVEVVEVDDLAETKEEYNIPRDVESCHTLDISAYFVEGHVPLEAIDKLIEDEPEIAGIALPEMPLGSPGMPGEKQDDFIIYAVSDEGSYDEFLTI